MKEIETPMFTLSPSEVEHRVTEVFARLRRGDDGAADLYRQDGALKSAASGGSIHGRDAIRAFYRNHIDVKKANPFVEKVVQEGNIAAAVIVDSDGVRVAIDIFELDDTGIRSMEVFRSPDFPGKAVRS